ncbi:unnamed protein product [Anisakis simplex]|uniref:Calsyntenin-1 (inferred by orthology to a D. melanogaster protein) n=1 Tax=Anisakis simplex TaxID=6269 RepID=A0A0M3KEU3_ANISI|nr:unnamed protein product [Anisakis simplex]
MQVYEIFFKNLNLRGFEGIPSPNLESARCGVDADTLSLLPHTEEEEVSENDENKVNNDEKYAFDGKSNAVIVPPETIKGLIPSKFTLSFSMKHAKGTKDEQNNKQSILCESDDHKMNRHHFSVYVRHCKLEMLMRRESQAEAAFRAAEWRWSIPEVCDDRWHTFSILFASVDQVRANLVACINSSLKRP